MENFRKFFGGWLSTSFPGSLSLGTGRREPWWLDLRYAGFFAYPKKSEVVILHNVIDEIKDVRGCLECC